MGGYVIIVKYLDPQGLFLRINDEEGASVHFNRVLVYILRITIWGTKDNTVTHLSWHHYSNIPGLPDRADSIPSRH